MAGPSPYDRKPRMRHSDVQLAALNDLYDQDEHPSLDERALLADRLGMYVLSIRRSLFPLLAL